MGMIKIFLLVGIMMVGVSYLGKTLERSAGYREDFKDFCGTVLWVGGIVGAGVCLIMSGFTLLGVFT